jgi:hypothetical protein
VSTNSRHHVPRQALPVTGTEGSADVGGRDGSCMSKSLSLSVTETSSGSGRLAGGISNPISDADRLPLVVDRSMSLSDSDTTFSLVVGVIAGQGLPVELSSSCLLDRTWDGVIEDLCVKGLLGSFSESFDDADSSAASTSGSSSFWRSSGSSSEVSNSNPRLSSEDRTIIT